MSMSRQIGRVAAGCAISLGLLAFGTPAFADDPVELPVAEDEVVALDEGADYIPEDPMEGSTCTTGFTASKTGAFAPPTDCTNAEYCDPHYVYGIYSNTANDFRVFDRWQVTNSTGSSITATFKADTGGSVSASASITLSAEASAAVFGKVSASVNAGVEKTMTASTGVSTTSSVKPYSTLKGDYGISRERVRMKKYYMYSNCNISSITYFDYSAPYRKGWKLYY